MKKRVLSFLLVIAMIVTMFAACDSTNDEPQQTEAPAVSDTPATPDVTEAPEEIVTVTWAVRGDPQDDYDAVLEAANKLLRERYNLELNLVVIPSGEYSTRMDLMITSGEEWDLCYCSSWNNPFLVNVNREAFLGLNDLLATETGKELLSVYPEGLTDYATVQGEVYALPNYQKLYDGYAAAIRKDLAEKYNLDLTKEYKDLDDLIPFMDEVLANEPDIWPLRASGAEGGYYRNYETINQALIVEVDDPNQTVKYMWENDSWNYSRQRLADLFQKGYIRADQATVTDDSADQMAGRYAVQMLPYKPGFEADTAAKYGGEYVCIQFTDVDYMIYSTSPQATMTAINYASKNPEAALKMYTVMWTDPEIYNILVFGIEGEHYTKVAENRVEQIADSGWSVAGMFGWQLGNQFNAMVLPGQGDDIWVETDALNKNAIQSKLAGFSWDSTEVSTELAQLTAKMAELPSPWMNNVDYTTVYDSWTTEMDSIGGVELKANLQEQIDAHIGK